VQGNDNQARTTTIRHWPAAERPREKLLRHGPATLSDAELLAIFLRTGCAGRTAVDLARDLLNHFGSLRAILSASREDFCSARGLGDAKFAQLSAVLEITRRHLRETLERDCALSSATAVRQYLTTELRHQPAEVFTGLFLDSQHRLIACEHLFFGTIDSASVHPREVVRKALAHNAAAMIFAHNHPSGITEPSIPDKTVTRELINALKLIDVRVLDHFIVGEGEPVSLLERGWM